ncbi:MAG: ATP-binding protein [Burkholderia sp.]
MFAHLDIALTVLYVAVALLVLPVASTGVTVAVAWLCVAMNLLGVLIPPVEPVASDSIARFGVSLIAVSILAVRYLGMHARLRRHVDLLNLTHDAVIACGLDDRITFWSHGAERLYGWRADEAVGQPLQALTRTHGGVAHAEIRRQAIASGHWQGELERVRSDGAVLRVASRVMLARDRWGRPVGLLAADDDVTEMRRMEGELRQQKDALLATLDRSRSELAHITRLSMLGEMAASIAHEVTQPLAAIVTTGEAGLRWLKREPPELGEVRASIEQSTRDAKRATEVIRRIRALAGKRDADAALVDVNAIVEESVELVRREMHAQGVALRMSLAAAPLVVFGDRVQLQQVLINLLMNAMQAMAGAPGGMPLSVATARLDGVARVRIDDAGHGISAANAKLLFTPFFTTRKDGMGMGLSICRSIVEVHGGHIWAESAAGQGARMQFTLPLAQQPMRNP